MRGIKNIIFDYGNVIFLIDFKKAQHSFTELGISNVEAFFAHAGHHDIFNKFEKGEINSAEFRNGVLEIADMPGLSDEQIDAAWCSLLIGVPPVNHEILLKAKQRYRTFLLSNINEIHLAYIENYLDQTFGFRSNDRFFEKVYYSHLIGLRKPNRDIFDHVLADSRLDPAETLFIDDSPQHLATGAELGLRTHLMVADDSLEKFMYREGLL